ncbi:MAG TPA: HTH domain-containing protein [Thermodesulfovibrionales bacterium]|nr:HTH domain-containing protein [Thermodesulfovibrionales bacterium]
MSKERYQSPRTGWGCHVVSGTRAAIAMRSRGELGLPAATIAREIGVSTSAITKAIERIEQDSK